MIISASQMCLGAQRLYTENIMIVRLIKHAFTVPYVHDSDLYYSSWTSVKSGTIHHPRRRCNYSGRFSSFLGAFTDRLEMQLVKAADCQCNSQPVLLH